MVSNFTDLLAGGLQRAAHAHEAHQLTHGTDPNWPEWYADRMTQTLTEGRDRLYTVLVTALHAAGAAHGIHEEEDLGGVHDVEWPAWYAEHMTDSLADDADRLTPGIRAFALV